MKASWNAQNKEIEIKGLSEEYVGSDEELFEIVSDCLDKRTQGSSMFFTVTISQKRSGESVGKTSKMTVIDYGTPKNNAIQEFCEEFLKNKGKVWDNHVF